MKNIKKDAGKTLFLGQLSIYRNVLFCSIVFALVIYFHDWSERQHERMLPLGVSVSSVDTIRLAQAEERMVNINSASLEELASLPGIGTTLAEAIIKDREMNGPFREANDLLRVNGIGKKRLAKIAHLLLFEPIKK